MKTRKLDSLSEQDARELLRCVVLDASGDIIGIMDEIRIDFSTHQIAYIGVKSSLLSQNVRAVPAANAYVKESGKIIEVEYSKDVVKNAPSFNPKGDFAEVEKETVNAYYARIAPLNRVSSIEQMRPEEAVRPADSGGPGTKHEFGEAEENRETLERRDQAFFSEKGFVTDAMDEVNASQELLRALKEAKSRYQEDKSKNPSAY